MGQRGNKPYPCPGWWKKPGLTIEEFLAEIDRWQAIRYERGDVEFTHDVYCGDVLVGEAGAVESVAPGLTIGFFALGVKGTLPPVYGWLDSQFIVLPKPKDHST